MAKAKRSKPTARKSAPRQGAKVAAGEESSLTKGQLRKLNALRKSLGDQIANKAFGEWLKSNAGASAEQTDRNAVLIADTLGPLARDGKLRIPRGGYIVSRGRGRVIVERARAE